MKFRTEIEIRPDADYLINAEERIFMLGSCFTDNVGALLERDGFCVAHNPQGPLYNPFSILNAVRRFGSSYGTHDLKQDALGIWHCLDFASRYQHADASALCHLLNEEMQLAADRLKASATVIITLGTAYVFERAENGAIAGNCHKFPAQEFNRRLLMVEECENALHQLCSLLEGKKIIFTVSPIRHAGDGLHGNQISKATLLLALDKISKEISFSYFPAYEIMLDDLRDYRFYATDMKHPSEVAVEYIYERFGEAYFTEATRKKAEERRKETLRNSHRPIIENK